MHYRIDSVQPLPDSRLLVRFMNGVVKEYDFKPLIKSWDVFTPLADNTLFKQVRVSHGGYGGQDRDALIMPRRLKLSPPIAIYFENIELSSLKYPS